ncbi:CDP-diacylglycerol/glycerol-3-phosphate 3-phosphatidyltransferase [Chondrus crispus]|uniref:CDP-diacylglycerol/glycerol-3-phosphate 3-phosphatidyltransferase n=1 Tax=Chondrus crispus TaxID=2769 RepID=R7QSI6_CHOCR|nr:CDP-diacylglycerol/glycerol-3-phosphate 3-phosphatidyltransferase [Chondrus crispus]CDF41084.1 CDP-diacylglycerol/glycerol-3-phosphate 3-phosphatidyltransferase [Chondrus crispus]|eukprot:XP_005711378.1 CDP-diacylglycerol/glycerol-3-phosphate 3-phosphatidyltransferase [Chondrus crispus]
MALTWARVAAIPVLCVTTLSPTLAAKPWLSALLFALASFTDFLDGYLARRWHVESALGVFLDPVADKLLVAVALTMLVARLQVPVLSLAAAVILAREIFVSALREWMAQLGLSVVVKVSIWGKIKTATQMLALTILLFSGDGGTRVALVGISLAVVSAMLALFSATEYVVAALQSYKKGEASATS